VLTVLVVALAAEASAGLLHEFWRLVLDPGTMGGVDLASRVRETHNWFDGVPIYGHVVTAVYPPGTYALLWPLVGWLDFGSARWLWASISVGSLAYLAVLIVRQTAVSRPLARAAVVVAMLAIYPTGQTIGNGQLLVPLLPLLLVALLLLQRPGRELGVDLLAALCLLVSLAKFTAVVPFIVVACFAPWRKRPLVLASLGYAGLTLVAAAYERPGVIKLLHQWLNVSSDEAATHGPAFYANVQAWLGGAGLKAWILPASVAILVALGYWTWRHRAIDPWLLIGVAAYASRFWSYHRSYDDVLILLPMVALLRIAAADVKDRNRDVTAALLLAATLAVLIVPGGLFFFPNALQGLFTALETVVWLTGLGFLLIEARATNPATSRVHAVARAGVQATATVARVPVRD
jgi:hypothetical protein